MGFRDKLASSRKPDESPESNLSSPLALRLCDALASIGGTDPRLNAVCRGFSRHLRKNPVPDEDILAALEWIEAMCLSVRHGAPMPEIDIDPEGTAPDNVVGIFGTVPEFVAE